MQSLSPTAALVMTMYDVATDPVVSTVNSLWIWHDGGEYFGVPISNFAGWVFVVYIFLQIFVLFISVRDDYIDTSTAIVIRNLMDRGRHSVLLHGVWSGTQRPHSYRSHRDISVDGFGGRIYRDIHCFHFTSYHFEHGGFAVSGSAEWGVTLQEPEGGIY